MTNILWGIIACGALSILYAFLTSNAVLSADQGNARMQEIAAAVREGAVAVVDARVAPEYSRAVSSSLMRTMPKP